MWYFDTSVCALGARFWSIGAPVFRALAVRALSVIRAKEDGKLRGAVVYFCLGLGSASQWRRIICPSPPAGFCWVTFSREISSDVCWTEVGKRCPARNRHVCQSCEQDWLSPVRKSSCKEIDPDWIPLWLTFLSKAFSLRTLSSETAPPPPPTPELTHTDTLLMKH